MAVLVMFLLGFSAFVIDFGILRASQRAMKTAVDAASAEGLRQRDNGLVYDRAAASLLVQQTFDDDFDLLSDDLNIGAGPVVALSTSIHPTLEFTPKINGYGVYDPLLRLNDGFVNPPANRAEGDMLAGNYDASMRHDEGYNLANPYERDDFPSGFAGPPGTHDSFLVRLRRTADWEVTDWNNIPGVSSSGPELPLLFGRMLYIAQDVDSGTDYSPRIHGLSFRATGIADAQPVLSVGPFNTPVNVPPSGLEGAAPYGLSLVYWNSLPTGVWTAAQVLASGDIIPVPPGPRVGHMTRRTQVAAPGLGPIGTTLTVEFSVGFPDPPFQARIDDEQMLVTAVDLGTDEWTVVRGVNGTVPAAHATSDLVHLHETACLTQEFLSGSAAGTGFVTPALTEFVPVFVSVAGTERIAGFGASLMRPAGGIPPVLPVVYPVDVEIMRMASFIPHRNAMAHLSDSVDPTLTDADVDAIFLARHTVAEAIEAPALVRSNGP